MQPSPGPSAAAPTKEPSPIDLDHLTQQTMGDRDLQEELLALFAKQAKGILAALGGPGGAPAVGARPADLLHTLCGSARAVGSWRVAAEAEDMERDLRAPSGQPAIQAKLDALNRSVGQACAAIDDMSHRKAL